MILLLLFHILALIATGFGIFYDFKNIQFPETDFQWHHRLGGKFKFISIQNMFIQFIYFLTAAISDIKGDASCPEEVNTIQTFKNNYFCGLAFPLALFVTINFWVLYFTNREQFFPQPFQEVVPIWHLHMLHTNVTVLMLMEMFFSFRKYPEFCTGLITIISYMLTYILWLHIIRYFGGYWVYPYLNDKKCKELYSYFGSILLQSVIIYMLGEILNNAIWQFELVRRECQLKCPN